MASSTFCTPPCERTPWNDDRAADTVLGSSRMFIVDTTSSAPNGLPSWNVTPWRRLNVHTVPSAFGDHFSASTGRSERSLLTQTRYSATCCAMAIEPVSYMVVGSTATIGDAMVILSVPPALGTAEALADALVSVVPPPQAASSRPMAVADNPTTVARTRSCRRVMRPFTTS